MRTLLKILQSDSSALWIKFYSLMYEAENVKNIVECCPDTMMEGCREGVSTMEIRWSEVTPEKDIVLGTPLTTRTQVWAFNLKTVHFCFFTDF